MVKFAKRAGLVAPSMTLAITEQANKLKAEGINVVNFGIGEPDFNTPQYIIDAALKAMEKGMTKYTAVAGTIDLRRAICDKLKSENNLSYTPEQIVVSNGAKQSLYNALQILVDEGDEVILVAPYWLSYPDLVKLCGGVCVVIHTDESKGFRIEPEEIRKAITPRTKAIILNSPNNPTGTVYSREELEAIAKVFVQTDIAIISDEIYEKLVYNGTSHSSIAEFPNMYEKTFVINGMSKAFAMTGWRIGYAAAPTAEAAKKMSGIQSHETSNANSIAQYASAAALRDSSAIQYMVDEFAKRRKTMIAELKNNNIECIESDGAFYTMVKVKSLFGKTYKGIPVTSALDIASLLIKEAAVAVVPCESFGADSFIRLSYALGEDDIKEGVRRIADLFRKIV